MASINKTFRYHWLIDDLKTVNPCGKEPTESPVFMIPVETNESSMKTMWKLQVNNNPFKRGRKRRFVVTLQLKLVGVNQTAQSFARPAGPLTVKNR